MQDAFSARRGSGNSVASRITNLGSVKIHSACLACRMQRLPVSCAAVIRRQDHASTKKLPRVSIAHPPNASEMMLFNWSEGL